MFGASSGGPKLFMVDRDRVLSLIRSQSISLEEAMKKVEAHGALLTDVGMSNEIIDKEVLSIRRSLAVLLMMRETLTVGPFHLTYDELCNLLAQFVPFDPEAVLDRIKDYAAKHKRKETRDAARQSRAD